MCELGSYNTVVAVWSCDLTPNDSDFGSLAFSRCAVDERYTFPQVVPIIQQLAVCPCQNTPLRLHERLFFWKFLLCGFCVIDSFKLEQRCVWVCVSLATLITKMLSSNVHCAINS